MFNCDHFEIILFINYFFQLCLPSLLANDGAILKRYFSKDQKDFISRTCKEVELDIGNELTEIEPGSLIQTDMCLVIDLLLSKQDLCDFCRSVSGDLVSI